MEIAGARGTLTAIHNQKGIISIMKTLTAALVVALLLPVVASAGFGDGEMFNQLVAMFDLDDADQQKLAVALITLGENLTAATEGVGDDTVDPRDMFDQFNTARETFHSDCRSFLSQEQFEEMLRYRSAIFYSLSEGIAMTRVSAFRESLGLSEDQVTALTLVVSDDLRRVVETFLDYEDREMGQADVDAMNQTLVAIRKDTRKGVDKILTSTQRKNFERLREEAKAEQG